MTKETEITSDERVHFLNSAISILKDLRNGSKPSHRTITLLKEIDESLLIKVYKEFKDLALRKGISLENIIDFSKHWSEKYKRIPTLSTERTYHLEVESLETDQRGEIILPSNTHPLIINILSLLELRNYAHFPDMYDKNFERLY